MIHVVSLSWTREPFARLRASLDGALDDRVRQITYEELFFRERGPAGHYIFTDLDRLTRYELDAAGAFERAVRTAVPDARILNAPSRMLVGRTAVLLAMHGARINDFTVSELQSGERPPRYPVFIRPADGHDGPETGLLANEAAFDAALARMRSHGVPLAGRIAVGAVAEPSADGFFRKYGAFSIGGRIIPQHVMRSRTWVVKSHSNERSVDAAEEELRFIHENPDRQILYDACARAGVEFGRVDYGVVGGRPQIYEINTNPHFPRFEKRDARTARRVEIRARLLEAFREIDRPMSARGFIRFSMPRPVAHPPGFRVSPFGMPVVPHLVAFVWNACRRKITRSTP